jgi:hypothetical protein
MMTPKVTYDREAETLEAKTRWFKSLSIEERMAYLDWMTDLLLMHNPQAIQAKEIPKIPGRVLVLSRR